MVENADPVQLPAEKVGAAELCADTCAPGWQEDSAAVMTSGHETSLWSRVTRRLR